VNLSPTLFKTMRKLLRLGARARVEKVAQKLSVDDIAALLTQLSHSESTLLLDVLLGTPRAGELLEALPAEQPEIDQGLAALSDLRVEVFLRDQPADAAEALLRRLPESRCVELRGHLTPDQLRVVDEHLLGRRRRPARSLAILRQRLLGALSVTGSQGLRRAEG
jgi:Mg/Co/Ni transporter MgtE